MTGLCCGAHLDQWTGVGGCLGKYAVMKSEKRKLETVGDTGFVVDGAKVVIDDLFLRTELGRDLLVLASLDDEADDLELTRSKTLADTESYGIGCAKFSESRFVDEALPASNATNTLRQLCCRDAAAEQPLRPGGEGGR